MSDLSLHRAHAASGSRPRPSAFGWLMTAMDVWRSRQQLNSLEPHMLEDIGIAAKNAKSEASRPIWDVPAHWLK